MTIHILPPASDAPKHLMAAAELHFDGADSDLLYGLRLVGFAIWRIGRDGVERLSVTFPARQYVDAHGEYHSQSHLQCIADPDARLTLRDAILRAYHRYIATTLPSNTLSTAAVR